MVMFTKLMSCLFFLMNFLKFFFIFYILRLESKHSVILSQPLRDVCFLTTNKYTKLFNGMLIATSLKSWQLSFDLEKTLSIIEYKIRRVEYE